MKEQLKEQWENRVYISSPSVEHKTLYGQIVRLAENQSAFLSIMNMLDEGKMEKCNLLESFFKDSHFSDMIATVRKLLESNKNKRKKSRVNSIMAFAEALSDNRTAFNSDEIDILDMIIDDLSSSKNKISDTANKVFSHNDLSYCDNNYEISSLSYDELIEIFRSLITNFKLLASLINIELPNELIPARRYKNWHNSFKNAWLPENFNDEEIWQQYNVY